MGNTSSFFNPSDQAERSVHSHSDGHGGHSEGRLVDSVDTGDGHWVTHDTHGHSARGHDREPGSGNEHAHVAHRGDGHSHTSGHHSSDRVRHRWGSNSHQHGHGHSAEDQDADNSKKIAVGDKVPDFEVSINGQKWKLSELQKNAEMTKDGTLVLTFWCSFCHSCRDVEHYLDELAKQYKGQAGVVALDASAGETTEGVAEFARERGLTLPIALDSTAAAADIFGVRVTTTTVVIDGQGVLRYCGQLGDRDHTLAEDALKAVLAGEEVSVKKTRHKG